MHESGMARAYASQLPSSSSVPRKVSAQAGMHTIATQTNTKHAASADVSRKEDPSPAYPRGSFAYDGRHRFFVGPLKPSQGGVEGCMYDSDDD